MKKPACVNRASLQAVACLAASFFFFRPLFSFSPEEYLQRINAHLLLQDIESGRLELQAAKADYPHHQEIMESEIRALAMAGEENLAYLLWKDYLVNFPNDESCHLKIAEEMAWGAISKGTSSHFAPIRLMGFLAAFLSQDARGVVLLKKGFLDKNTVIRALTVKLASQLHDQTLVDEIASLVHKEKCWKVRIEAIKTAGEMKIKALKGKLMAVAADSSCHALEQAAAIGSLVKIQKKISRNQIENLVQSDRAGMRLLACEMVAHFELKQEAHLLRPLLDDYSADVRARALYTLGVLRIPIDSQGAVSLSLEDRDDLVALTAAWVMALGGKDGGRECFKRFLNHPDEKIRHLTAGAIAATGYCGISLMKSGFDQSKDPYVRLNLALGLIGQRHYTEEAADAVFNSVSTLSLQWMENEDGFFNYVTPSTVKHDELIPNYPEAVNQMTRLKLLNLLVILKHPRAQDAIKAFLQEKKWGITGIASALLLTEGDDRAVDIVKELLQDPSPFLSLQAALTLARWGEEEGLAVLQEAYPIASYEDKQVILEGIGRLGSKKAIPFLIEKLQESHQSLRIIAAAGIIQAVYS